MGVNLIVIGRQRQFSVMRITLTAQQKYMSVEHIYSVIDLSYLGDAFAPFSR